MVPSLVIVFIVEQKNPKVGIAVALLTAQESWGVVEKTGELGYVSSPCWWGMGVKSWVNCSQSRIDKSECHDKFLMKSS